MVHDIIFLILGFVFLVTGGTFVTNAATAVAKKFHVSNLVIGLTVVAFGSSLPDWVVGLTSTINHKTSLALGEVVGAAIFDLLLVVGVAAMIRPMKVSVESLKRDFPMALITACMFFICTDDVLIDGGKINMLNRSDGLILLCGYAAYMVYMLKTTSQATANNALTLKELQYINENQALLSKVRQLEAQQGIDATRIPAKVMDDVIVDVKKVENHQAALKDGQTASASASPTSSTSSTSSTEVFPTSTTPSSTVATKTSSTVATKTSSTVATKTSSTVTIDTKEDSDSKASDASKEPNTSKDKSDDKPFVFWKVLLMFGLGVVGLVVGGNWVVDGASGIAYKIGWSEGLVGLTIVAIGASLPDMTNSIIAAIKGNTGIAIGNVLGCCTFDVLFVLGSCSLVHPLVSTEINFVDYATFLVAVILAWIFATTKQMIDRKEGAILVLCYAAYMTYLIISSTH